MFFEPPHRAPLERPIFFLPSYKHQAALRPVNGYNKLLPHYERFLLELNATSNVMPTGLSRKETTDDEAPPGSFAVLLTTFPPQERKPTVQCISESRARKMAEQTALPEYPEEADPGSSQGVVFATVLFGIKPKMSNSTTAHFNPS